VFHSIPKKPKLTFPQTLLVLLAEFYAIIHGKKLCGLGIGSALKTSVDHLLNGAAPPSDVEDGTSSTAKDRGSVL